MQEERYRRIDEKERRRQQFLARRKRHRQKQALVFGGLLLLLVLLIVLICFACGSGSDPESEALPSTEATELQPIQAEATLVAFGDNLLHQQILNYCGNDFTPLFADLKSEISSADLACLFQETILVNDVADTSNNITSYGTISAFADSAQAAGFDVIAQATEHAYDKGMKGIQNTAEKWNSLGVTCLGVHDKEEPSERYLDVNNIRICLLNYTYYTLDTEKPEDAYAIDYLGDEEKMEIAEDIARGRQNSDIVIVFAHWGEIGEYEPNAFQTDWAKFFADNGVGAVIGSHPHVLQPVTELTRTDGTVMPVFYSLGNYMTHMNEYYNMLGGMAQLTITKDEHGTYVSGYQLVPLVEHILQKESSFVFRVLKLEDYRADLASSHQFPKASVANMVQLWQTLPGADTTKPISSQLPTPQGIVEQKDWAQIDAEAAAQAASAEPTPSGVDPEASTNATTQPDTP